ncbi:MAG: hypothetical protein ACKPCG_11445 [Dolichospermum sp.]
MDIQNSLDTINTYQWNSEQLKGTAILSVYALKGIVGYAASQNKPVEELSPMEIVEGYTNNVVNQGQTVSIAYNLLSD